ncbi:hypothetical protein MUO14_06355 [Halobacillus shinanisalinarum]|uniref:Uncharacterized protein n=1 Tax=Halobacillus shinanisalinarum TaxID=2932258 RepID=A0ABY4H2A9_9BACI|nr:hypothetical protein [Halobacillus shinanisalinarum]UOQ94568.1 hypothetical protein MUO14_06355 [Halobacillus shinanisalinarum]
MTAYPEFHYGVYILDLNDDLSDEGIEDVVHEIGYYSEADDLELHVLKHEHVTEEQDRVLKEQIKPNQYPYFLIIRGENEELNRIKNSYKKNHPIRNFFKMIHPDELQYSTQDYMLNFERTVYHADNTKDTIAYLVEYLEILD